MGKIEMLYVKPGLKFKSKSFKFLFININKRIIYLSSMPPEVVTVIVLTTDSFNISSSIRLEEPWAADPPPVEIIIPPWGPPTITWCGPPRGLVGQEFAAEIVPVGDGNGEEP